MEVWSDGIEGGISLSGTESGFPHYRLALQGIMQGSYSKEFLTSISQSRLVIRASFL